MEGDDSKIANFMVVYVVSRNNDKTIGVYFSKDQASSKVKECLGPGSHSEPLHYYEEKIEVRNFVSVEVEVWTRFQSKINPENEKYTDSEFVKIEKWWLPVDNDTRLYKMKFETPVESIPKSTDK